ncbi:hypothetical protein IFM12275_03330 [Nocardia sputorum]|nr:hypothetical protein IFM12275_03330 [Nocardia sputorum]
MDYDTPLLCGPRPCACMPGTRDCMPCPDGGRTEAIVNGVTEPDRNENVIFVAMPGTIRGDNARC